MPAVSSPTRQKSWRTGRERVSVLAELALRKEVVSQRLTQLREEHGLSQERAAGRVGVTVRQWQRWESGTSVPYPRNFDAIAEAFGISVAEFFDGTNDNGTPERPMSQLDRIEAKLDLILAAIGLELTPPDETDDPAQVVEAFRDAAAKAGALPARAAQPPSAHHANT